MTYSDLPFALECRIVRTFGIIDNSYLNSTSSISETEFGDYIQYLRRPYNPELEKIDSTYLLHQAASCAWNALNERQKKESQVNHSDLNPAREGAEWIIDHVGKFLVKRGVITVHGADISVEYQWDGVTGWGWGIDKNPNIYTFGFSGKTASPIKVFKS